jgi:predicted 2-oxoglutarate/Fe(II)-dependent dioxygenase YbiX
MLFSPPPNKSRLFVRPDFFEPALCSSIREEMCLRPAEAGKVLFGRIRQVDESTRQAKEVPVSTSTVALVRARLFAMKPVLEERFQLHLRQCQTLRFISYSPGDFFLFHRDKKDDPEEPPHVTARQVSVVLFLNSQSETTVDGVFRGGSLRFYAPDLLPGSAAAMERQCISIRGQAGLLVAFPPRVRHEVQPVVQGRRFTIVTWFI